MSPYVESWREVGIEPPRPRLPTRSHATAPRPRRGRASSPGPSTRRPHSAEETPPLIAEGHILFRSLPHLDLAGHAEDDGVKQVRALERERPGPHRHEIDVLHLVTSELDGTLAVAELRRGILAERHRAEEVGRVEVVPARAAVLEVQPVGTPVLEHDAARPEREVDERDVDLLGPRPVHGRRHGSHPWGGRGSGSRGAADQGKERECY